MSRVAATVAGGLLIAIVSYATDRTFGLFVIGLIIVCLIAYLARAEELMSTASQFGAGCSRLRLNQWAWSRQGGF
jgi:hypothetical protein